MLNCAARRKEKPPVRPAYRRISRRAILWLAGLSALAFATPAASAAEATQKILSRPELGELPAPPGELADAR
jgi:hypothetical protein